MIERIVEIVEAKISREVVGETIFIIKNLTLQEFWDIEQDGEKNETIANEISCRAVLWWVGDRIVLGGQCGNIGSCEGAVGIFDHHVLSRMRYLIRLVFS